MLFKCILIFLETKSESLFKQIGKNASCKFHVHMQGDGNEYTEM